MKKKEINVHLKGKVYNQILADKYLDDLIQDRELLNRGLSKIGMSLEMLNALTPIKLIGYEYGELTNHKPEIKLFKDRTTVSTNISATFLYFGQRHMYIFNHTFTTLDEYKIERLAEIYYKDINSIIISGKVFEVEDRTKTNYEISNNYMSIGFGADKIEFPIMPDIDINNEELFHFRKLVRDKKFL